MRNAGSEDEVTWGKPQHRMGRPCHLERSSRLMFAGQVSCCGLFALVPNSTLEACWRPNGDDLQFSRLSVRTLLKPGAWFTGPLDEQARKEAN